MQDTGTPRFGMSLFVEAIIQGFDLLDTNPFAAYPLPDCGQLYTRGMGDVLFSGSGNPENPGQGRGSGCQIGEGGIGDAEYGFFNMGELSWIEPPDPTPHRVLLFWPRV